MLAAREVFAFAIFMGLDELMPLGRRPTRRRHRWRLHRLTDVREDSSYRPGIGDERDEPDITAACRADQWKRLGNPREQLRPREAGGVVRAILRLSVGTASGWSRLPRLTARLAHRLPIFFAWPMKAIESL